MGASREKVQMGCEHLGPFYEFGVTISQSLMGLTGSPIRELPAFSELMVLTALVLRLRWFGVLGA